MPVPKRKTSKSRRDLRSSTKRIRPKAFCLCPHCGAPLMPHKACLACGFYKGSKVLRTKNERATQRKEIKQAREARKKETQAGETEEPEKSEE